MRHALLLVAVLVAGCQPMISTTYEVVPPASIEGRYCANECLSVKQYCEQACRRDVNACEQMNLIESQTKYIVDSKTDSSPDMYRGSRYCSADECMQACTANYNICHTNCGGQVIPRQQCTAFCN